MSGKQSGMDLDQNNLDEKLITQGKSGTFSLSPKELSDICILDNHYKVPGKDMILSSQMIMSDQFGGMQGIAERLKTDLRTGIEDTAVNKLDRTNFYGANSFPPPKIKSVCELIIENFEDPINRILCGAAIVSLIIGIIQHWIPKGLLEGTSIMIALFIIIVVNSGNNYLSEKRLAELVSLSDEQEVQVFRGSAEDPKTIDAKLLVVGDVIRFKMGQKIPADCILIDGQEVECTETELTGEPDAMEKVPVDASNFKTGVTATMMAKSLCTKGFGTALVVAVGSHTVAGVITEKTQQVPQPTLLQRKLTTIADKIGHFGLAVALLTLLSMIIRMAFEFIDWLPCNCQNLVNCQEEAGCTPLNFNLSTVIEMNGKTYTNDYRLFKDCLMSIIISITVVVVAIPEGLPLAVTISLSVSSKQMQKLNNLVRKLASSETMGGATHICSDKTGTLTQNKMTVMAVSIVNKIHMAGETARTALAREVQATGNNVQMRGESSWKLLTEGILWNSPGTTYERNEDKKANGPDDFILTGNVTEQGMLKFFGWVMEPQGVIDTQKQGYAIQESAKGIVSFTSSRKRASFVIRRPEAEGTDQEIRVYCKGAPDMVLVDTTQIVAPDGSIKDINDQDYVPKELLEAGETEQTMDTYMNIYQRTIKLFANQAYRTILVTFRDMSYAEYQKLMAANNDFEKEQDRFVLERNLCAIGVFGIQDPLRDGIAASILKCRDAGITTIMCTGDNIDTAIAISKNAGIVTTEEQNRSQYACMTGKQFREAVGGLKKIQDPAQPDKEDAVVEVVADMRKFREIKPHLKVLARSSPEDKYILVLGIQTCDGVVAVTGDGTNDAPALTKADVGFAMGITGTDVAKGACDIILLDDNFTSIVVALKYGRNVYDNVRKFLQFQLTVNCVAMAIVFLGSLIIKSTPLNAVQMLWVNLIMDTFAALALATEAPYDSILERPPYHKNAPIVTEFMWRNVFGHAIYQAIAIFTVIFAGQYIGLCLPYENSCISTDYLHPKIKDAATGHITRVAYCTKFNAMYSNEFYLEEKDMIKFWKNAVTLKDGIEDDTTEELKDQVRPLVASDFDEDSLVYFVCDQYSHRNADAISQELKDNRKWNKENPTEDQKATSLTCDKQYLIDHIGEPEDWTDYMPANAREGTHTQKLLLFTFVFQAFVFMQIFNQFNARKLDGEFNVFSGIFRNGLFTAISILTVALQMIMVQYGGHIMKTQGLTFKQNMICIAIGFGELICGLILKFLPLGWFQCLSLDERPMEDGKKTIVSTMKKSSVIPNKQNKD